LSIVLAAYIFISIAYFILGLIGIIGGIFIIQNKHRSWAIAGMIVGCITLPPAGIAAMYYFFKSNQH
jgi:hypothetical protein